MEQYLLSDIIYNIISYLNKNDSFNFINICKSVMKHKYYLYKKYIFNCDALDHNNEFMHYIETIHSTKLIDYGALKFNNLTTLKFDLSNFDIKPIEVYLTTALNNLPKTLLTLSIEYDLFNLPLPILPLNLKALTIISNIFNQSINNLEDYISLEYLHINSPAFNQSLKQLPITLIHLYICSSKFTESLCNLPVSLRSLHLFCHYYYKDMDFKHLSNLISFKTYNRLPLLINPPPNLTELQICNEFIASIPTLVNYLPNNLKILNLHLHFFNCQLNNLPQTLENIILISDYFNQSLYNLPNSLKHLIIISPAFNECVNNLPDSLLELQISSNSFNKSLTNLPKNLEILKIFSYNFNHSLDNLPLNLQTLILDCKSLRDHLPNQPINLKTVIINDYFSYWSGFHPEYKDPFIVNNCDWCN